MPARVSVLVNTYNHETYIAPALQSALDQDFPADQTEIIVVDDGSTDRTPEIVRGFVPRVRYIRKQNGGQVSAFNVGVAEARGEIICFLDGDDYWAPNRISAVVNAFDTNPAIGCVGHAYYEVDSTGQITATVTPTAERLSFETPERAREAYPMGIFLGTSRFAIRRSVLQRTLPVPPDLPFFDNFVFSQAIAISGALLLQQPLCYYRLHASNLWATESADQRALSTKYRLMSGLLHHLPARLAALGLPEDVIAAYAYASRPDTERLRLKFNGGRRSDAFRIERECFQIAYRHPDFGYRIFKSFVLFLTLLLPPKMFYRLRDWYGRKNLKGARRLLGDAEINEPPSFIERRKVAAGVGPK